MPLPGRNNPRQSTFVLVQYANGLVRAKRSGSNRTEMLVGFYSQLNKDEDFDRAAHAAGLERVTIKHMGQNGTSGTETHHWFLGETLRWYPLTSGPVVTSVRAILQRSADMAAAGIGYRWSDQERRSRMSVAGFLAPLLEVGFQEPVRLSVKGLMTQALLDALLSHHTVLLRADEIKQREVGYYELALPLVPGQETSFGSNGASTTVVPLVSGHPAEDQITREYLRGIYRPEALLPLVDKHWDAVVGAAVAYSASDGYDNGNSQAVDDGSEDEPPPF